MEHAILILVVVSLCTLLTRALPFLVFQGKKQLPEMVTYLGKVLPAAIMAILTVYCLKSINFLVGSRGIPELLAVIVVVLIHIWKKNTLLSIGIGTIFYMFLVQVVFG